MKSKRGNIGGRNYLVAQLKKRGLSRRRSLPLLNQIFREMKLALARGESVEFPFGKLQKVKHKHRKQQGRFLNRILTTYKKPFTVELVPNARAESLLRPPRPRPRVVLPPKPWLTGKKTPVVPVCSVAEVVSKPLWSPSRRGARGK